MTDSRAQDVVFNSVPVSPTRIENEDVFDNEFRMRIEARLDLGLQTLLFFSILS